MSSELVRVVDQAVIGWESFWSTQANKGLRKIAMMSFVAAGVLGFVVGKERIDDVLLTILLTISTVIGFVEAWKYGRYLIRPHVKISKDTNLLSFGAGFGSLIGIWVFYCLDLPLLAAPLFLIGGFVLVLMVSMGISLCGSMASPSDASASKSPALESARSLPEEAKAHTVGLTERPQPPAPEIEVPPPSSRAHKRS